MACHLPCQPGRGVHGANRAAKRLREPPDPRGSGAGSSRRPTAAWKDAAIGDQRGAIGVRGIGRQIALDAFTGPQRVGARVVGHLVARLRARLR